MDNRSCQDYLDVWQEQKAAFFIYMYNMEHQSYLWREMLRLKRRV